MNGCAARSGRRAGGAPGAVRVHNGTVGRGHAWARFLESAATWPLTVALAPLVVVAGESLRLYALCRPATPGRSRPGARLGGFDRGRSWSVHVPRRRHRFLILLVSNPLWIALTAPARWLLDRAGGRRRQRPPDTGVREPRRPRPVWPAGSIALAEPRTEPIVARLLGTLRPRLRRRDTYEEPRRPSRVSRAHGRQRRNPS